MHGTQARMSAVEVCDLPPGALLAVYRERGAWTDCYTTTLTGEVSHVAFVEAFYTTRLFKLERLILKWCLSRPSSDSLAAQLAGGHIDTFAAWRVEGRAVDQLLLADVMGRTRSWLMTAAVEDHGRATTRLYFGSAVVPSPSAASGQASYGAVFRALLGFHKLYSRLLLRAASARLAARLPS